MSAALALLLAAGLSGCEPSSTSGPPGTATSRAAVSTVGPTTSAQQAAEAAVLADYERFWADYIEVSKTADYNAPRLAEHATGDALRRLRLQLLGYHDRGLVARGQPMRTGTEVTSLRGHTATVTECLDANQWRAYDAKTGEPAGQPDGKTNQVRASLTRTAGRWKVAELDIRGVECDG